MVTSVIAFALAAIPVAYATTYASTTTFLFTGSALPTGLAVTQQTIGDPDGPYKQHEFVPENAYVSEGYLNLLVDGGQQDSDVIYSGQVHTSFTVASARVDTHAILSDEAGVCNGAFYYVDDDNEIDIEWLSNSSSQANVDAGLGLALFYTNQPGGTDLNSAYGAAPSDATTAVHIYRIDWDASSTTFYLDGVEQANLTRNVPQTTTGQWYWNNWSNGNQGWSSGPPVNDAVFKIEKIVMQYNPGS
ncbi:concanavalin A-like lectin/glucanase [Teratosphaeria nubilosa]|uniref:Concanavalin A-like lectin/glucanase n=1 Tax=Teratosphaeria nubilosa TaxID=161662 RepID=A0A6G1LF58_9PEZI|nr:concanavalin A-like lectin/glucanase [Teratosphaeria nubilosa]